LLLYSVFATPLILCFLSLHKQHFVTAHFQFIIAHFVFHCTLKNALVLLLTVPSRAQPFVKVGGRAQWGRRLWSIASRQVAQVILSNYGNALSALDPTKFTVHAWY